MPVLLPLFPLSHVLLPGMPLPLHIFELRYRELLADVTADHDVRATASTGFGVVALRTGTEAETPHFRAVGPDVADIGTVAEILELERAADGTADLLAVGSRRFRIASLVPPAPDGTSYLRAQVEYLDEPDGPLTDAIQARARDLMDVYDSTLTRIAGRSTGGELPHDPAQLSYQIAARLPLQPAERQALLADDSSAQRLVRVARLLRREIALLHGTRSIAVSPSVLRISSGVN